MTKNIRERIADLLTDELIIHNITHEIPPPGRDCFENCGVVDMHTGMLAPVRSGGKKHKKCMDCWNEYITELTLKLLNTCEGRGIIIAPSLEETTNIPEQGDK